MTFTLAQLVFDDERSAFNAADVQAAYESAADLVHVSRTHPEGDPEAPCSIKYPSTRTFCTGARQVDFAVAKDLLFAGWAPPPAGHDVFGGGR